MDEHADRVATFRDLHRAGCFVIPNPWDAGSARVLAQLGFPALATTSSGFAWSLGRRDNNVTLWEALHHVQSVAESVSIPVNADFEGGFAVEPKGVAENVTLAAQTGVAGLSIEDSTSDASNPLFDFDLSVARVRAARKAIDESGSGVLLTARCESFLVGRPDLTETIRRLRAYADAGADCLYAPSLRSTADIKAIVDAVLPKPVNVLMGSDFATVADLAALGVRRISVGGALARAAWTGFLEAAREIAEHGTFGRLGRAVTFADLNAKFDPGTGPIGRTPALHKDLKLFVAYAHEDREIVVRLVEALAQRDWKIYWDEKLAAGQGGWAAILESELQTSFGVIVVWSQHSVKSPAVLNEARIGREHASLCGISIDESTLPAEFDGQWSVDLRGWHGDPSDSRLDRVLAWPKALSAFKVGLGVPLRAPDRASFKNRKSRHPGLNSSL